LREPVVEAQRLAAQHPDATLIAYEVNQAYAVGPGAVSQASTSEPAA
jgi:hypothetical protein